MTKIRIKDIIPFDHPYKVEEDVSLKGING